MSNILEKNTVNETESIASELRLGAFWCLFRAKSGQTVTGLIRKKDLDCFARLSREMFEVKAISYQTRGDNHLMMSVQLGLDRPTPMADNFSLQVDEDGKLVIIDRPIESPTLLVSQTHSLWRLPRYA